MLSIEVPAAVARAWLARHPAARGLSYGYVLFAVRRGSGACMIRCHVPLVLALWAGSGWAGGEAR